ncbi:hypothetical protein A9R05_05305 [Burkholderia sp. KK1]|nr:hypothetical protein A9R05_05305 [Burkholderia sp. KK1]
MPTDAQILEAFEIPGLNIEASLEPREVGLFLQGCRALLASAPASELSGKDRWQWESDHDHRALQDPYVCEAFGITPPAARKEE